MQISTKSQFKQCFSSSVCLKGMSRFNISLNKSINIDSQSIKRFSSEKNWHRGGAGRAPGEHADRLRRRPLRPGPAVPAARARGPQQPAGLRLPDGEPQQGAHRVRRQAAGRHPGVHGVRLRLPRGHAGSGDPRRGQSAGAGTVRLSDERGLRQGKD